MTYEPIYDPVYDPPERRPPRRKRSTLDSPLLSAAIVVVVLGLVAAVFFVPGMLPPGPAASARPSLAPTVAGPTITSTFARPTPSPAPTFLSYTVQAGDTLNSIARQFDTTGRSIAWWNRGTYPRLDPLGPGYDPNTIRVGWVLLLLPGTVVDDANPPSLAPSPGG
jgi:hypothetical protein